jgi:hypothetical protein
MKPSKDPLTIPSPEWPKETELGEALAPVLATAAPSKKVQIPAEVEAVHSFLRTLVSVATNAWRAKEKMKDPETGEIRDELKRVDRHVEAIIRNLAELGVVIRDHTGDTYDEGQPMKVIGSKPTPDLTAKRVSETLLPSVFWNERLVQNGEVEIATPAAPGQENQTPNQP